MKKSLEERGLEGLGLVSMIPDFVNEHYTKLAEITVDKMSVDYLKAVRIVEYLSKFQRVNEFGKDELAMRVLEIMKS